MPLSRTACSSEYPQARNHWSKISLSQLERKFVLCKGSVRGRIIAAFNHPSCFPALRASRRKEEREMGRESFSGTIERTGRLPRPPELRYARRSERQLGSTGPTRCHFRLSLKGEAGKQGHGDGPHVDQVSFFRPLLGSLSRSPIVVTGKVPPLWRANSLGTAFTLCGHHLFAEHPRQ
jgi:hypothetical protein